MLGEAPQQYREHHKVSILQLFNSYRMHKRISKMKGHLFAFTIILSSVVIKAQPTLQYYEVVNDKKGSAVKTALMTVIDGHTQLSYKELWGAFRNTDCRLDGRVWDMYSNVSNYVFGDDQNTGGGGKEGADYSREHSMPKSWFHDAYPMYTDLFHIYPTDSYVNNMRGNYPFGEVGVVRRQSENGFSKLGESALEGYSGIVFEPADEYKGDFARTYFYMVTRYETDVAGWSCDMLNGNTYPAFTDWAITLLLKWHRQDPVSEKEINRNDEIYRIQHNRNPYIDYPVLAEFVWGKFKSLNVDLTKLVLYSNELDTITTNYDFELDGIFYKMTSSSTVEVVSHPQRQGYSGDIAIPSCIEKEGRRFWVKSIKDFAFLGCENLISVSIPEGLEFIGKLSFSGCSNLASIVIPNSVTNIGSGAFSDCSNLFSIVIPDDVTTIEGGTFRGCDGLHSVIIGREVLSIHPTAFRDTSIEKVIWKTNSPPNGYCNVSGITNYVSNEQYILDNIRVYPYIGSIFMVDGIIYVPNNPSSNTCDVIDCLYDKSNTFVNIDSIITYREQTMRIENVLPSAFYMNDFIKSLEINGAVAVGYDAFYNCSNLLYVTIGNAVKSLGESAFSECQRIVNIKIADGLKSIEKGTFYNCKAMTSFEIGKNVENIEEDAFFGCSAIEQFTCYAKQTPKCAPMALDDIDKWNCTLRVPEKAVGRYKVADQWESFFFVEGFQVEENIVTYVVDGETYGTAGVEYGEEISLLDAPQKEGYTFSGWQDVPEVMPAEDITIYGYFTINKYAVNYMVDGKVYQTDSVTYDDPIVTPDEPIKEGYAFSGWNNVPETMPASDVTISGSFTINKYLVTFKIGDEVIASDSLEYATTIVVPEAPEKEGHTFNGWGEVERTVPAHDVIYEGSYSVNSYNLIYMVDDMVYRRESVKYNTPITVIEEPVKEGHAFSGWSEVPEMMPANDVTVSGIFVRNKYLVTFKIDGVVVATDSLEYGTTIIAPTVPERKGYTFSGWGKTVGVVPANDVTFEGSYTVNIYKVYYFVGATLVHTAEVAYGETIPEYVYEPIEESYTFLGWIGDNYETMPAHDVTYTANIDDAIRQLTIDNSQLTIYDLSGRKIEVDDLRELEKGIYIVNGQKMTIKD